MDEIWSKYAAKRCGAKDAKGEVFLEGQPSDSGLQGERLDTS